MTTSNYKSSESEEDVADWDGTGIFSISEMYPYVEITKKEASIEMLCQNKVKEMITCNCGYTHTHTHVTWLHRCASPIPHSKKRVTASNSADFSLCAGIKMSVTPLFCREQWTNKTYLFHNTLRGCDTTMEGGVCAVWRHLLASV